MDLRDEVAGTEGTIWTNHFLRTGFEVFSTGEGGGYVAEKAETASGWLFPVGDELAELGYVDMFADMLDALDEGRQPVETFYDGYVVNAVMDACYASARSGGGGSPCSWPSGAGTAARIARERRQLDGQTVIKEERMPDGRPGAHPQGRADRRVRRRGTRCLKGVTADGDRDHPCLGERGLRRCESGERHAVGRAADVVEPELVAERDRARLAAVLAADAELEVGLTPLPRSTAIRIRSPTPSRSSVSNGLRSSTPCSR